MAVDFIAPDFDGGDLRIGIVQARFNEWAGRALAEACLNELVTLGVDEDDITHITVPGALEVPLVLARLAATEDFDALIAIGCVIRGETYHFEIVAEESARGVAQVAAQFGVPVANAILTTDTDEQARARVDEKGRDAARVAVEMANLMLALDEDGEGGAADLEE
ncbi:MAG: 6,7-dimethyl-8-ribityllumazine synthase [Burkholderiaceae bacterium]|jgi:6,7-dimethyl-8-ribityllumazine synthase|nr:6,7-dimethyl-8-ribityllumazine synthase [Burkholderiaceae bacterium]